MPQRLSSVRTALLFLGGLLPAFSLAAAPGCAAQDPDIVHPIPIQAGGKSPEAGPREATVARDPATTLTVEAVGPSGEPVAGARAFVLHAAALDPMALVLSSRVTGDRTRTLIERATWRGRTSKDGQIGIPMAGDGGCLIAFEAGGLYGEVEYRGRGGEALQVTLTSRRAVALRVLNSDGTPAEGVALTARAEDAKGVLTALPITAVTGSDGSAVLHVPIGGAAGLEAMARLAMDNPPRVAIVEDVAEVIQLPPMGALEIEVQGHPSFGGAPSGLAQAFAASDGSRSHATLAVPIVNGRAILPRVQAGVSLRVICAVADGAKPSEILASQSVSVAAVAAGETGTVRVSFDQYQRVGRKLEPR